MKIPGSTGMLENSKCNLDILFTSKNERFVRFYCIWYDEMKVLLHYEMIAVKTSHFATSYMWNRMSSVVLYGFWHQLLREQPHASAQQNLLFTHVQDRVEHFSALSLHLQVLTSSWPFSIGCLVRRSGFQVFSSSYHPKDRGSWRVCTLILSRTRDNVENLFWMAAILKSKMAANKRKSQPGKLGYLSWFWRS